MRQYGALWLILIVYAGGGLAHAESPKFCKSDICDFGADLMVNDCVSQGDDREVVCKPRSERYRKQCYVRCEREYRASADPAP